LQSERIIKVGPHLPKSSVTVTVNGLV